MTVIADTSRIHYAVAIDCGHVLIALYSRLVIPAAVWRELTDEGASAGLRAWLSSNSDRIEVRPVAMPEDSQLAVLDAGEREAIALAQNTPGALLIMDERDGRKEAVRRGIAVTRLLGIIRDAALRGLLDFEVSIARLKATDFRLSPSVEETLRRQYLSQAPKCEPQEPLRPHSQHHN